MHARIVKSGSIVKLSKIDTRAPEDLTKEDAEPDFEELAKELGDLQELLYAAGTHSVLVVLQGMDTSGKDGSIRNVFKEVDPVGLRVASFKVPTPEELAHDFLWRVHGETPGRGDMVVFNRSHYEDVLIVRVLDLVPRAVWKPRYERITEFERLLKNANTIVLKFFLHICKHEQAERLREREADPTKAWKLAVGDWEQRRHWDAYQKAYEDALSKCSTDNAPWHIVPADQKWYRNLAVAEAIVERLRPYAKEWRAKLAEESKVQLDALEQARTEGKI